MTFIEQLVKRPAVIAAVTAIVAVPLLWVFLWMSPQSTQLSNARAEETALRTSRTELVERLSELRHDAKKEKADMQYLSRFGAAIPTTAQAPQLVVEVYNLAHRAGVTLSSVSDNSVVSETRYSTIPVSITVSGGFANLVAFVDGLYGIPRLLTIQSLNFSGAGMTGGTGNTGASATITATAYSLHVAPVAAASA